MSARHTPIGDRWAIVQAWGPGDGLRLPVRGGPGTSRHEQSGRVVPLGSMLERTLARAECLVPRERIVIVVGPEHGDLLEDRCTPARLIVQPRDRGTLPGLLLPLAHILAEDPDPTAWVFPCDHQVEPEGRFLELVGRSASLAEFIDDGVVLLAAVPDRPGPEYGWIQPGPWASTADGSLNASWVQSFVTNAGARQARDLFHRGYLWNSRIMVARGHALWRLARELVPGIGDRFSMLLAVLRAVNAGNAPSSDRSLAASHVYAGMARADFGQDILEAAPERAAVVAMEGVQWSEWGSRGRIAHSLRTAGDQMQLAPGLARALGTSPPVEEEVREETPRSLTVSSQEGGEPR